MSAITPALGSSDEDDESFLSDDLAEYLDEEAFPGDTTGAIGPPESDEDSFLSDELADYLDEDPPKPPGDDESFVSDDLAEYLDEGALPGDTTGATKPPGDDASFVSDDLAEYLDEDALPGDTTGAIAPPENDEDGIVSDDLADNLGDEMNVDSKDTGGASDDGPVAGKLQVEADKANETAPSPSQRKRRRIAPIPTGDITDTTKAREDLRLYEIGEAQRLPSKEFDSIFDRVNVEDAFPDIRNAHWEGYARAGGSTVMVNGVPRSDVEVVLHAYPTDWIRFQPNTISNAPTAGGFPSKLALDGDANGVAIIASSNTILRDVILDTPYKGTVPKALYVAVMLDKVKPSTYIYREQTLAKNVQGPYASVREQHATETYMMHKNKTVHNYVELTFVQYTGDMMHADTQLAHRNITVHIRVDHDVQANNVMLYELPPSVLKYSLVYVRSAVLSTMVALVGQESVTS